MHLRRALLLFAIVLGLAALATSLSGPASEDSREARSQPSPGPPEAAPQPRSGPRAELLLPGPRGRRSVELTGGQAATLLVSVPEAGRVDLPTLGLSSPAETLTPARFELFGGDSGSHEVYFTPAESGRTRRLGQLVVRPEAG